MLNGYNCIPIKYEPKAPQLSLILFILFKDKRMATKKTIAMFLISLLVVMMACTDTGEAMRCGQWCQPQCMKVKGASQHACEKACNGLCLQLGGKGGGDFILPLNKNATT